MKTTPRVHLITRLAVAGAILCTTPIAALAKDRDKEKDREKEEKKERVEVFAPEVVREHTARLESRSVLPAERTTITKEYITQRAEWLELKYPERVKFHAYFDTLLAAGYDPLLLDAWLDGLLDGTVVVGMPGELVLSFYGEPAYRKEILYEGVPALEWGIPLLPGRVEKVTAVGSKVVRVKG